MLKNTLIRSDVEKHQSLIDAASDKIRKYRADYNNRPPSVVSFMPAMASTIHLPKTHPGGQFTFRRAAFLTQLQIKVGLTLAKAAALRVNLNLDGAPIVSKSHTHPSHSQTSCLLTSSLFHI
jgi:hypothetical protein